MDESDLRSILDTKIANALGYWGDKLTQARTAALQYYNGEPFGNEEEGRSQVVSRDVAEAIDSMMPSLMKIFTSGDEVVRFEPTQPQDEEVAQQATDYVNWIWNQQNDGYKVFYDWFKDGLLNRTAVVKIFWEDAEKITKEQYEGLTDEEYDVLLSHPESPDDDVEVIEETAYPDPTWNPMAAAALPPLAPPGAAPGAPPLAGPPPMPPAAAPMPAMSPQGPMPLAGGAIQPVPQPPMLHDCTIRRTSKDGRVVIVPMPGEEFLIDRRAVSLGETPFCAHRFKRTVSQLVEEGYPEDKVKDLGDGDATDFNQERIERFGQEDGLPYRNDDVRDPAMREVWVTECYIKTDFDGDGKAELRKVTVAGSAGAMVILDNEEIDDHPFAALSPIPMPHKFFGMSIADQTMDVQLIKSTLLRSSLDHMYTALMPQMGVVEGRVNLDDLLTRRPGGVVRMKDPTAIIPLPSPGFSTDPFAMIAYMDQVRAQRTGVQPAVAGPGSDVLNNAFTQTATGANIAENASQERLELVARTYAEMGVKPAFKKVLQLVCKHQQKPKMIRLRGQWVNMDPQEWDTEFDMTVSVGLGTGNRAQQLQLMMNLLTIDQGIIQMQGGITGPLVTASNVYKKLEKVIQFGGLKSVEPYYTDPKNAPPMQGQQKPPDPTIMKTQMQIQADQQKAMFDAQNDQQKTAAQIQADQQKFAAQLMLDREKASADLGLRRELGLTELSLQARKLGLDEQVAAIDAEIKRAQVANDAAFRHRELAMNEHRTVADTAAQGQEVALKQQSAAPRPKVKGLNLVKGPDGLTQAAEIHFDDGSMHPVQINRMIPGSPAVSQ